MSPSASSPLPSAEAAILRGCHEGWHTGAQLHVSLAGTPVASLALGERRDGEPLTPDTLMLWLSATKPIVALAILQLWERGRCDLDDRVATHIPEFGQGGKEPITIRQLLIHTAGFRRAEVGQGPLEWAELIDRLCRTPLEPAWTPGGRAGYHAYTSWYVLGELIRRLDGRRPEDFVRAEIFEPLGMTDCWLALSPERAAAYGPRIATLVHTDRPERPPHTWSEPGALAHCAPGATGRGPVAQLARFYDMLLAGGALDGVRLVEPQTVAAMTARQRQGMFDETFLRPIDWGLGVIINARVYDPLMAYGYGRHASPETFGHSGNQSSVALADPRRGLAIALAFDGMPGERVHQRRVREVLEATWRDLGLADA